MSEGLVQDYMSKALKAHNGYVNHMRDMERDDNCKDYACRWLLESLRYLLLIYLYKQRLDVGEKLSLPEVLCILNNIDIANDWWQELKKEGAAITAWNSKFEARELVDVTKGELLSIETVWVHLYDKMCTDL